MRNKIIWQASCNTSLTGLEEGQRGHEHGREAKWIIDIQVHYKKDGRLQHKHRFLRGAQRTICQKIEVILRLGL